MRLQEEVHNIAKRGLCLFKRVDDIWCLLSCNLELVFNSFKLSQLTLHHQSIMDHIGVGPSSPSNLKVNMITMVFVLVIISQMPLAASQRNMSLTLNDTDSAPIFVWDSKLKTDEKCQKFRSPGYSRSFFVWPEDQFRYCCSSYNSTIPSRNRYRLVDFAYHQHSARILTGEYHDLVRVDRCLPYWRCWSSEPVNLESESSVLLFQIDCEIGDLRRLYTHRFWSIIVAKAGILMSALPLLAFLEVAVLLTTLLLRLCRLATSPWMQIFTLWCRTIKSVILRSWLHLIILTLVGNCFVEAIGHQDPYTYETMVFDNFIKVYLALTIILTVSVFTQQVVDWRLVDKCIRKAREQARRREDSINKLPPEPEDYINERHLHSEFMDDDWRWQPIFMQVATLALLGLYIRYAFSDMREDFAALLLAVAATASTWSALVAVIIFCRKLSILSMSLRPGFPAPIPPKEQKSSGSRKVSHQLDHNVV